MARGCLRPSAFFCSVSSCFCSVSRAGPGLPTSCPFKSFIIFGPQARSSSVRIRAFRRCSAPTWSAVLLWAAASARASCLVGTGGAGGASSRWVRVAATVSVALLIRLYSCCVGVVFPIPASASALEKR